MPTLEWIGKEKVINHHQEVPFRVLEERYTYGAEDSGNLIIRGDNLEALKALLPQYEGRVKCIYIDPPYNTGNEGWVYNDNVNDPKIRKWLGEVVGKEGEDLSRHDKWLCMMYPRLKLLQKLLAEDGAIFISISDVEEEHLKLICNEIFGAACFVARITWQNNYSPRNDANRIPYETDNILIYSKTPNWGPKRLPRTDEMDARYTSPDNDPIPWTSSPAHAPGAGTHRGMVFAIQHPITGELLYPPVDRHWNYEQSKILSIMNEWAEYELRYIDDAERRASICNAQNNDDFPMIKGVMLSESLESAREKALTRYKQGSWPTYYFTGDGTGGLRKKSPIDTLNGKTVTTLWQYSDVGTTVEAKNQIKSIFNNNVPFGTPKPVRLIERILQIASDPDSLILDSFAGSGTTAHAVLNMNKADGGHRKFILVEMMDYAESITAERVKRVIDGYGEGKSAVEGTGGGFRFCELGEPLLIDGNLNETVGEEKIREYVWFTETKRPWPREENGNPYYLGKQAQTAYYFYYERKQVTTLDYDFLSTLPRDAEGFFIYADLCVIPPEELSANHITFKKIPRDIAKL